jgi:hypothetical protein
MQYGLSRDEPPEPIVERRTSQLLVQGETARKIELFANLARNIVSHVPRLRLRAVVALGYDEHIGEWKNLQ